MVQTKHIITELSKITDEKMDVKIIKTTGDKVDSQLYKIDVKGIFTKELDRAVLDEEVDFAVHSLKDLPTELADGLEIVAVPPRESPREVLVSKYAWDEIPDGATLGTGSLRREAFCRYHQKNFNIKPIRGNVDTRVKKIINGEYQATIMAEAGLRRLGLTSHIREMFTPEYFTPAAGQGALAIVARQDSDKKRFLEKLNHFSSAQEVKAEKMVLEELGVGCQWPIGVSARAEGERLDLYSILLTREGKVLSQVSLNGSIAEARRLGRDAARLMREDCQ
jgi:hydroxymethylbilane synthase